MGWNYFSLANMISAVGLFALHITRDNVPWYLTVILFLNCILVVVSSLIMDSENSQRDKRIKNLEKELQELKREKGDKNEMG